MPQVPAGTWQMEEVYGSNPPNSSACYFYNLLSSGSWFNANATYKLRHKDLDIALRRPAPLTSHFLGVQLPHCDILYFQ